VFLDDGSVVLGGLAGKTRTQSQSVGTRSLTGLMQLPDGTILGVCLDGVSVVRKDHGKTFTAQQREDREPYTTVLVKSAGKPLAFSKHGVVTLSQS
jgi:hypothetical protein